MEKKTLYIAIFLIVALSLAVIAYENFSGATTSANFTMSIGQQVPESVVARLNVPSNLSNMIGAGSVSNPPSSINESPLLNATKPEILYIGAEYCPYCAITRWGLIIALLRFGSFSNLHYMASNASDTDPNTPTFSFYNSTYTSSYIHFTSVEIATRSRYQSLQSPTAFQNSLISAHDPTGGIPFIDFANLSMQIGAPVTPGVLQGLGWNETIDNLTSQNPISEAIVGTADLYTAQICLATNMTPASVCSEPYVTRLLAAAHSSG